MEETSKTFKKILPQRRRDAEKKKFFYINQTHMFLLKTKKRFSLRLCVSAVNNI
jgi:hypothetical protein